MNPVAGHVRGREERETHDVVPMHMGHEDVVGLRRRSPMTRQDGLPEGSHAASEITQDVMRIAGLELDTRRMSSVSPGDMPLQASNVVIEIALCRKRAPRGAAQRREQFL